MLIKLTPYVVKPHKEKSPKRIIHKNVNIKVYLHYAGLFILLYSTMYYIIIVSLNIIKKKKKDIKRYITFWILTYLYNSPIYVYIYI